MKYDIHITSPKRVLADVSDFELKSGAVTLLLGESGIGKTIISRAIFGLLSPTELDIQINGESYSTYLESSACLANRKNVFFVFQEPS